MANVCKFKFHLCWSKLMISLFRFFFWFISTNSVVSYLFPVTQILSLSARYTILVCSRFIHFQNNLLCKCNDKRLFIRRKKIIVNRNNNEKRYFLTTVILVSISESYMVACKGNCVWLQCQFFCNESKINRDGP